jgi:ankyrin repeat protein
MKQFKKISELLKLKKVCKFRDRLKELLRNTSDLEQIKAKLIDCIANGKDIDFKDKVLKKYQDTLLDLVLDEKNKQLKQEFLNDNTNPTGGAQELRLCLLQKFRNELSKKKLNIKTRYDFQNAGSKLKPEMIDLPNDKIDDEEIDDFLDKLVLAVNQPNEMELDAIIEESMGEDKDINLLDNKFVASEILVNMMEWTKKKKGTYLTQTEGEEMFRIVREKMSKLMLIGPTKHYCKVLESYGLSFANVPSELEEFLGSIDQQILILINSYKSVFSAIKVHQTLKNLKKYNKDDSFIFSPFQNLQNIHNRVLEAFESSDLLIIECATSNDEMDETFASDLSKILRINERKKLILISTKGNRLPEVFENSISAILDDRNSFNDLSQNSQELLLSTKQVSFQGYLSLIDRNLAKFIDADILNKIMSDEILEIGKKLPDLGEVGDFFVPRNFKKIQISDSILSAAEFNVTYNSVVSDLRSDQDIILISDKVTEDYEILCGQFKEHTIHWLQKKFDWNYSWVKSQGSNLSKLRKYLVPHVFEETNSGEMKSKVVILTAKPGMGKSTELTRVAKKIKASDPSYWVLRVNLIDCSSALRELGSPIDETEAQKFLHTLCTRAEENIRLFEKEWFHKCLEQYEVVVLFDGFDEISPYYKDKVIELLKVLKGTKMNQLWITTRPYGICTELEDQLATLSHTLTALKRKDIEEILINIWKDSLNCNQAKEYAKNFIRRFLEATKDGKRNFFDNPLQVRMIATVFLNAVHSNDTPLQNKLLTGTSGDINLAELYEQFFRILFDRYIKEKNRGLHDHRDEPDIIDIIEEKRKKIEESYKKMALYTLYDEEDFERLLPTEFGKLQSEIEGIKKGSHKMGIVDRVIDSKPIFVHRTFAEYFVALLLSTETMWKSPHFKMFMQERFFINCGGTASRFFARIMGKNEGYEQSFPLHAAVFRNDIESMLKNIDGVNAKDTLLGWSPLQYACQFGFWGVVELFLQKGLNRKDMLEMFAKSSNPERVIHHTARKNLLEITKILIEINNFDLEKSYLYSASKNDSLDVMEFLMERCEFKPSDHAKPNKKKIALFAAVHFGAFRIVKYLLETCRVPVNVLDDRNQTPLLLAIRNKHLNVVQYLATVDNFHSKRNERYKPIKTDGNLPKLAIKTGSLDIVKCLVNTGKIPANFTDKNGETLLHMAAHQGSKDILEYLGTTAKISLNTPNKRGETPAFLAVMNGKLEVFKYLTENSAVNPNQPDYSGKSFLHAVFLLKNPKYPNNQIVDIVRYLVDVAKVDPSSQDKHGKTALHYAAGIQLADFSEILSKMPEITKNIRDNEGQTALHLAAKAGQLNNVKVLMKDPTVDVSLTTEDGQTILNFAILSGKQEVVDYIVGTKKFDLNSEDN